MRKHARPTSSRTPKAAQIGAFHAEQMSAMSDSLLWVRPKAALTVQAAGPKLLKYKQNQQVSTVDHHTHTPLQTDSTTKFRPEQLAARLVHTKALADRRCC